jgi:hypothetical protein
MKLISLHDYLRPWKLLSLSCGLTLLIVGSFYEQAPDWDIPISLIMGVSTYLTAPWCMRILSKRQWRWLPLAIFWTWFSVDGCYAAYWSIVDPQALALMREANFHASLFLFLLCGFIWMPDMSLHEVYQSTLHALKKRDKNPDC